MIFSVHKTSIQRDDEIILSGYRCHVSQLEGLLMNERSKMFTGIPRYSGLGTGRRMRNQVLRVTQEDSLFSDSFELLVLSGKGRCEI